MSRVQKSMILLAFLNFKSSCESSLYQHQRPYFEGATWLSAGGGHLSTHNHTIKKYNTFLNSREHKLNMPLGH